MFSVLLVLFVLETHHSASLSGIVVVCSQVPGIIASPIAGALLDRGSARRPHEVRLPHRLRVHHHDRSAVPAPQPADLRAAPRRVGSVDHGSAQPRRRQVAYPLLTPRSLWDRTNAADSGTNVVATVLGPGVAGVAVAVVGPRVALLLPALVMLVAAALLLGFVVPGTRPAISTSVLSDARAAVGYVWRNRVLRMLASTMTIFNASSGILTVALPFIVLHGLHRGSATVGLLFAVMGGCGFLAGLLTGRFGTESREKHLLAISCATTAVASCSCAGSPRSRAHRLDRRQRHGERPVDRRDVLAPPTRDRPLVVRQGVRGLDEPQLRREPDRRGDRRCAAHALDLAHTLGRRLLRGGRWPVARGAPGRPTTSRWPRSRRRSEKRH